MEPEHCKSTYKKLSSLLSCEKTDVKTHSQNIIRCLYLNARSIVNKIDYLNIILRSDHFDLVFIVET